MRGTLQVGRSPALHAAGWLLKAMVAAAIGVFGYALTNTESLKL